jgi:hypothetical protein
MMARKHADLHRWDEQFDPFADRHIEANGEYLCIQWSGHPRYIYRRMQPGTVVHSSVDSIEHEGQQYCLAWIEDEKEHATARRI